MESLGDAVFLSVFDQASLWRIVATGLRLFLGGLERSAGYRRLSGAGATVAAGSPLAVHCDGDPAAGARRIDVELRPRALEIVVPGATASDPGGPFTPS